MRGRFAALAVACAVGLTCAALVVSTGPAPPAAGLVAVYQGADPAVRPVLVRSVARDLVAREWIAGRVGLPDAAARFGWLNALPPTAPAVPPELLASRAGLPAGGRYVEGETLALQVVAWVVWRDLSDDRDRAREAAVRQFRECRTEGRLARLPEVPGSVRTRLLAQAEAEVTAWYGWRLGD